MNKTILTALIAAAIVGIVAAPQVSAESDFFTALDTLKQKTVELTERNERLEERLATLEQRVIELEYMAEKFANSSTGSEPLVKVDRESKEDRKAFELDPEGTAVFNCVTTPCVDPQEKRQIALAVAHTEAQAAEKADKEMPEKSNPWWKFWE
jgi:hypothetical protein